ncbi:MAG: hypothetical protein JWP97_2671 [Labilithrix sp.]|nr:hypothetical protein [Labilithrix sp.]
MESTVIRHVSMSAMLVGPNSDVADRVTSRFEESNVKVVRAGHAAAACERLAVAMPQVVVVLGSLRADEREALADRATAIGALLMDMDPELDDETLGELVARAARAAIERKFARDESGPAGATEPPGEPDDDEVDSRW